MQHKKPDRERKDTVRGTGGRPADAVAAYQKNALGSAATVATKIAVAYLVLGTGYILISDWAVESGFDEIWTPGLQSFKGTGFVLVSAIFIWLITRSLVRHRLQTQEALHDRERTSRDAQLVADDRLRVIAEHARDMFWLADAGMTRALYVSTNSSRFWGYSAEELVESPEIFFSESIAPDYRDEVAKAYKRAAEEPLTIEYEGVRSDGQRFRVQDRTVPGKDETGRTLYVVGISEDVTAERAAQDEIEAGEARLLRRIASQQVVLEIGRFALEPIPQKEFLQQSCEAIAAHLDAPRSSVVLANPDLQAFRVVGGTGWRTGSEIDTEFRLHENTLLDATLKAGKPILIKDWRTSGLVFSHPELTREFDVKAVATTPLQGTRRKLGAIKLYWDSHRDLEEDVEYFLSAVSQIVSSRFETETHQRLVEGLMNALDAEICLIDRKGQITLVNGAWRKAAEVAGVDPDRVGVGVNYIDVCGSAMDRGCEEGAAMVSGLRSVLDGTTPSYAIEYPCPVPGSEDRTLRVTVTSMTVEGYPGAAIMHTDITEIKRTEKQLQQSQKLEAIGRLTGGVAHDFNNLLTVISGNLQLLERRLGESVDPKVARWIEISLHAVTGGSDLTQRLLAFSRRQVLEPSVLSIGDQIPETIPLLERTLGEDVEIVLHAEDDLPNIRADRSQLESALLNLAVNARDAMPEGGRLTIETYRKKLTEKDVAARADAEPGDYVVISVTDTGSGMSEETLAHVFEPFFTTKAEGRGTGLGLSMVFGFLKQSDGHATIYSEPGMGTCVRLYFPVWHGDDVQETAAPTTATRATDQQDVAVLLVEDNENVRETAVSMLDELGFRVVEAANGVEALERLRETADIGLVLTDVVMPGGMSGFDVAAETRRLRPEVRVVCASGFSEEALKNDRDVQWRGDAWLAKPYSIDDLARKIQEAMTAERMETNE
ncbi:MAG: ATP-binding protein [Alphaproteobacteria bacterium]